jgi:hypothetical protein
MGGCGMIFTSYFAKIRKFPTNVIPVAICASVPSWYTGARYTKLAPDYDMLMQWKIDHRNDDYTECFNSVVLGELDAFKATHELHMLLPEEVRKQMDCSVWQCSNWHIALVCYEKPSDFCHRHIVADWLCGHGIPCEEWEDAGDK